MTPYLRALFEAGAAINRSIAGQKQEKGGASVIFASGSRSARSPQRYPRGPSCVVLANALLWKILVTRVNKNPRGLLMGRRNLARPFRHHQAISDPELGQQNPRLGRVDLDLLPELA